MAENSKIEWCDHTVNLWHGCYEVHKGCDNCYAKQLANRYHGPHLLWQQHGPRMLISSAFNDIRKYQNKAAKLDIKYYVFMNSMSDIFEKSMPVVDFKHQPIYFDGVKPMDTEYLRIMFFDLVDECPNLIFLLLTKRPSNIVKMIPQDWIRRPRANVLFGTSVVDQQTSGTLIPQLLKVPGRHFLSMEPLVDEVNITQAKIDYSVPTRYLDGVGIEWTDPGKSFIGVDWVIVGGESGFNARPMNSKWAEYLKDQCDVAGVPFFFKQWGEWLPLNGGPFLNYAADGSERTFYFDKKFSQKFMRSNDQLFYRLGKHASDSLLNGKQYKQMPL